MDLVGIGTDIIECVRIRAMIDKHGELFLRRVFTEREIRYCQHRGRRPNISLAGGRPRKRFSKASARVGARGCASRTSKSLMIRPASPASSCERRRAITLNPSASATCSSRFRIAGHTPRPSRSQSAVSIRAARTFHSRPAWQRASLRHFKEQLPGKFMGRADTPHSGFHLAFVEVVARLGGRQTANGERQGQELHELALFHLQAIGCSGIGAHGNHLNDFGQYRSVTIPRAGYKQTKLTRFLQ